MKDVKRVAHPGPAHGKTWCWSWGTLSAVSAEIASVRLSAAILKSLPTSRVSFTYPSTIRTGGNRPSGENSKQPASKLTGVKRWGRTDDCFLAGMGHAPNIAGLCGGAGYAFE